MKKCVVMLFLFLIGFAPAMAQGQANNGNNKERRHFSPEEFQTMMRNYIRDKAGLSQAEADKLFPIYLEMKTKQMELNGKMMGLKRKQLDANADSKEYCSLITQITNLNVELAKVEQVYYAKMCKVVDAKKVYKVMGAEDAFHREMLWRSQVGNNNRRWNGAGVAPGMPRPGQGMPRNGQGPGQPRFGQPRNN